MVPRSQSRCGQVTPVDECEPTSNVAAMITALMLVHVKVFRLFGVHELVHLRIQYDMWLQCARDAIYFASLSKAALLLDPYMSGLEGNLYEMRVL